MVTVVKGKEATVTKDPTLCYLDDPVGHEPIGPDCIPTPTTEIQFVSHYGEPDPTEIMDALRAEGVAWSDYVYMTEPSDECTHSPWCMLVTVTT